MFFYKGIRCPIFSLNMVENDLYLDDGWSVYDLFDNKIYYKGYSTECKLDSAIYQIVKEGYKPAGKWCVIYGDNIYHPKLRGYPIYKLENSDLTNIPNLGGQILPSDEHYEGYIPYTLDKAAEKVGDILLENITNFLHYNKNVKMNILYSMGLDSLTCWAIFDYIHKDYNLHIHLPNIKHRTFEETMGVNREYSSDLIDHLSKHCWGYQLTKVFSNKNYYLTGFYSEAFQLREVSQGHAIANYLGTKLHKMIKPTDYLYHFLQRPNNKVSHITEKFTTEKDCKQYCYNLIFYDYQMWHIDKNFHFSPFYDIRIPQICYRMSIEDILKNAANGVIQRKIIERFNPEFLMLLSEYKNAGNIYKNFSKNWSKIKLSESVNINIT